MLKIIIGLLVIFNLGFSQTTVKQFNSVINLTSKFRQT